MELTGVRMPKAGDPIIAGGSQELAIRAEGDSFDPTSELERVLQRRTTRLFCGDSPEFGFAIMCSYGQPSAVRAKSQGDNFGRVREWLTM